MRSDAFARDPYGHVTNQCGHVVLGLAASILTPWHFGGDIVTISAVYWLVSEVLLQRRRLYLDAAQDTAFVAAGAAVPFALSIGYAWALVLAVGAALALGAWVRR